MIREFIWKTFSLYLENCEDSKYSLTNPPYLIKVTNHNFKGCAICNSLRYFSNEAYNFVNFLFFIERCSGCYLPESIEGDFPLGMHFILI